MSVLAIALISVLMLLAALHLYWGLGGRWPGRDVTSLLGIVAGRRGNRMFGLGACAAVAGALTAAASVVWVRHAESMAPVVQWIIVAGYFVLILVFGGRGLAPYLTPAYNYARGTPFFNLNRQYYAPLCLAIAAALIVDHPLWG